MTVNTISFKNKSIRTRFANLFSHIKFKKEDVSADGYDQVDYDLNPNLLGNPCVEYNLVFKGEISAEMRKKIKSYKSIVGVVSVIDVKDMAMEEGRQAGTEHRKEADLLYNFDASNESEVREYAKYLSTMDLGGCYEDDDFIIINRLEEEKEFINGFIQGFMNAA